MRNSAGIFGHPVHPILVSITIGGLVLSFACDLAGLFSVEPERWIALALYAMYGGIVGALLAALPGVVDLVSLPAGPARSNAITHMVISLTVVALFLLNALLRVMHVHSFPVPISLSLVAIMLLFIPGWLDDSKVVYEHGVGVNLTPVPLAVTHE